MSSVIPGGTSGAAGGASGGAGGGAIGAGGLEPESRSIELHRLQAAIMEALALCGLQNLQDAFAMYLKGSLQRLAKQGVIDLGVIWQPLSEDSSIKPEQAGKVLLLVYLYVENVLKVPVAVADHARPAMDAALQAAQDLPSLLPNLVQGVERRLQKEGAPQKAEVTAPKPAAKKEPPAPKPALVPAATPRKQQTGQMMPREVKIGQNWLLGIFAFIVVGGLGAYWGRFYLQILRAQNEYRQRQAQADVATLSEVLPITSAKLTLNVLKVVAKDEHLDDKSDDEKRRIGLRLLRTLNLPSVNIVQVLSGDTSIVMAQKGAKIEISSFPRVH